VAELEKVGCMTATRRQSLYVIGGEEIVMSLRSRSGRCQRWRERDRVVDGEVKRFGGRIYTDGGIYI
jgi:hypothetical protein